ncbi:hypothetical protein QQ045_026526 [Rhodiola kirilowii]
MGADNMRIKLPHLIRAVRQAGLMVTWVSDPMHGRIASFELTCTIICIQAPAKPQSSEVGP